MPTKLNSFLVYNSTFFATKHVQYGGKVQNSQILKLIANASLAIYIKNQLTAKRKSTRNNVFPC